MMRAWYGTLLAVLALARAATPAGATASGLLLIPTADTLGADQYQLEPSYYSGAPSSPNLWILGTEVGIGERWELGVDMNLDVGDHPRAFTNWKYAWAPVIEGRVGYAVGVDNWDEHLSSGAYLLGTGDLGSIRLTAGFTNIFGANRMLAGIDTGFDHPITLMADYTSGADLFSSAGVSLQFGSSLQLQVGAAFPNGGGEPSYIVLLALNGRLRPQPPTPSP